jgi:hypothetical protein
MRSATKPDRRDVSLALQGLLSCLSGVEINQGNMEVDGAQTDSDPETSDKLPGVFIAFDEAQSLAKPIKAKGDPSRTYFIELRSALQVLDATASFVFFLSTTSKISQFAMPADIANSERLVWKNLRTPLPFSDLGFDHLMRGQVILSRFKTIDKAASTQCVVHMGRPL